MNGKEVLPDTKDNNLAIKSSPSMTAMISVIVSAYNAERFINDCLLSIENQEYQNLDIIVLDDGSTDCTADICREHAEKDSRIRFFHFDERKGQGCRRNHGIRLAKGDFIAFVDADDVIHSDMFRILAEESQTHNADIVACKFQTNASFERQAERRVQILDGRMAVKHFLTDPGFGAFPFNKIYRKDLLQKCGEYPEDIFYEDVVYIPEVCANAEKVVYSSQSLYYYRQHDGSVTGSSFTDVKMDQLEAYIRLIPYLLQRFPDLNDLIYEKAFFAVMGIFNNMKADCYRNREYNDLLLRKAKEYRSHFSFSNSSNKKRTLIFSAALLVPALYGVLLQYLYRRRHR